MICNVRQQERTVIKHIIWDFDGTLFDTYSAIVYSFVEVLRREFNLSYDALVIEQLVRADTKHCAEEIGRAHGIGADMILTKARSFYNMQDVVAEKPYDDAKEICAETARRGSNALVTHRDKDSTLRMLERFNMIELFVIIITGDDGFAPKPAPDSMQEVLRRGSLLKQETLAVGDRDLDIEAARRAGIRSAFFSPNRQIHPKADFNICSLAEIRGLE
jgi:HAD superfamily hydrolase (TIGR01549 family)